MESRLNLIDSFRKKRSNSKLKLGPHLSSAHSNASVLDVPYSFKNEEIDILYLQEVTRCLVNFSLDYIWLQNSGSLGKERNLGVGSERCPIRSKRKSKIKMLYDIYSFGVWL